MVSTGTSAWCAKREAPEVEVTVNDVEIVELIEDGVEGDRPEWVQVRQRWFSMPQRSRHGWHQPARVRKSPDAKSVTSWPRLTSESVSVAITRSVPP